jgi:hypothetical protein
VEGEHHRKYRNNRLSGVGTHRKKINDRLSGG